MSGLWITRAGKRRNEMAAVFPFQETRGAGSDLRQKQYTWDSMSGRSGLKSQLTASCLTLGKK